MARFLNILFGVVFILFGIYMWNNPTETFVTYSFYLGLLYVIWTIITIFYIFRKNKTCSLWQYYSIYYYINSNFSFTYVFNSYGTMDICFYILNKCCLLFKKCYKKWFEISFTTIHISLYCCYLWVCNVI